MMTSKIAFRNIFRQKRRSFLTILTMFGGFALAAVSIAWSDGTYSNVINMFTRNQLGHVQIHREGYLDRKSIHKTIDNYNDVASILDTIDNVVSYTPRLYSAGLASVDDKSSAAQIIGIDPQKENKATRFDKKVIKGQTLSGKPSMEVILGRGLATRLKADVSDSLVIVSQAADGSIANDIYYITGIIESGDDLSDQSSLYLHIKDAQELFWLHGRIHEVAVVASDLDVVDELTMNIKKAIDNPDLAVASWKEFAKSFYQAMRADQQGAWIMLFVVILVVAVGVLNTVLMTVLERRREYGVLRAIGTSPKEIFTLVLTEVIMMALIGIAIGLAASYAVNYYLSIDGIRMPEPFTYGGIKFTHMYTELNIRSYIIPGIAVIITAIVVSLFPARQAAKVAPAKAMRMH